MQNNWSRRYDFVALEADQLASMLHPVFPGRQVTSVELLTAGLVNTNYKIRVSGLDEAFVLRIYLRDQEACARDRAIFELVQDQVPVPELLYTHIAEVRSETNNTYTDSVQYETVYPTKTSGNTHFTYAVMKWVDGVLLSDVLAGKDDTAIAECAYDAGVKLANIGKHTFPQAGFFGPDLTVAQPFPEGDGGFLSPIEQFLFKERGGQRLGPVLRDQLWQFVTDNVDYLKAQDEAPPSLVHADYKGFNILVRQEPGHWRISAVLDWEFAFAGSQLTDIANMLRYDRMHPPAFEAQFIQGFQDQGGHLPVQWKRASKLVDLLSLCYFMNSPIPDDARLTETTGLIVGTMDHWEEYAR
ncbi:MAG TPA: phosphotransferase [Ktedonosporobacter sp.]|nr:phosphotransferase [Ktedonosporobacter sp.]